MANPEQSLKSDPRLESCLAATGAAFILAVIQIRFGTPLWFSVAGTTALFFLWWTWRHHLFLDANAAYKKGQWEKSRELATAAIAKRPFDVGLYVTASAAYQQLNQPEAAVDLCSRALAFAPNCAQLLRSRASAHLSLFDAERALADINDCIRLRPHCGPDYLFRIGPNILLYRYKEAIQDCNKAIEFKSSVGWARLHRAAANLGLNNVALASDECAAVIASSKAQSSPDELSFALALRASTLIRNLQFEEAIADCTKAIELSHDLDSALIDRAHCYCCLGRFEEALADLDRLESQGCNAHVMAFVLSNKARVHLHQGRLAEAVEDAEAATKSFAGIAAVMSSCGLVLMRAGQLEKAEAILGEAISRNRYYAEAYWFRHELYEKMAEPEKAAQDKQIAESFGYKPYI